MKVIRYSLFLKGILKRHRIEKQHFIKLRDSEKELPINEINKIALNYLNDNFRRYNPNTAGINVNIVDIEIEGNIRIEKYSPLDAKIINITYPSILLQKNEYNNFSD